MVYPIQLHRYEIHMTTSDLSAFLKMLHNKLGFDFNVDEFTDRLKIQKYVFLSKYFGWEHGYSYNLYIRGPYSKELADDYYNLPGIMLSEPIEYSIPTLDVNGFVDFIHDKDENWLESAATILSVFRYNKGKIPEREAAGFALSRTKELKPKISSDVISKAYRDLANVSLMPSHS
jgi:uncharacterized protein YwgA